MCKGRNPMEDESLGELAIWSKERRQVDGKGAEKQERKTPREEGRREMK